MASESPDNIRTYRDLVAWQLAMELAEKVFRLTAEFPKSELYGMVGQMRRAAVSVPANVAEGYGRGRKAEFKRFLEIARGSLFELQTHAELARRMKWIKGKDLTKARDLTQRVDAVLTGLLKSVKRREA